LLHRCIEGGERVLMLAVLALRRHHREPSGHIRPEEAFLSLCHRSPRCFDVAAVGVGVGGSMPSARLAAATLLSAAMSSCIARSWRYISNDTRIALSVPRRPPPPPRLSAARRGTPPRRSPPPSRPAVVLVLWWRRRWRWGQWWWWCTRASSREHGVGC
jgi:hypothetical protein